MPSCGKMLAAEVSETSPPNKEQTAKHLQLPATMPEEPTSCYLSPATGLQQDQPAQWLEPRWIFRAPLPMPLLLVPVYSEFRHTKN